MKNLIKFVFLITFLLPVVSVAAPGQVPDEEPPRRLIETHNAIESASLRISMDDSLNGFVEGKVCDTCEVIKVTITPATKAFENDVEVPLKRAESRIGRFATVIYALETKQVSAIRWWRD